MCAKTERRLQETKQQLKDVTRNLRDTQESLSKAVARYQFAEEANARLAARLDAVEARLHAATS